MDTSCWKVPVLVSNFRQGMIAQVSAIQSITEPGDRSQGKLDWLPNHLYDLVSQKSRDLDTSQQNRLAEVLLRYTDLFPAPGSTLTGHTDAVEHEIGTGHSTPICCQVVSSEDEKRGMC